jgi:PPIC-type PPIASE domain
LPIVANTESELLRRFLAEPLLHFLLLGIGLFVVYQLAAPASSVDRKIVVSDSTVSMLAQRYASVWMRQPTLPELQALVDTHVRDEILYREGVALGLDRNDPVIQRRVLQKLAVLSEEQNSLTSPTDAELDAYLQANAARYALPPVLSFEQVLFDPIRHGTELQADFNAALAELNAGKDPATLGDSSMLPARAVSMPLDRVARDYGDEFAAALEASPVGVWQGPVRSGFGIHIVRIDSKSPGHPASLAEVRAAVERDWENARRIEGRETYYQTLLKGYEVQIDADLSSAALLKNSSATNASRARQ